jgi:hypothetical protein
MTALIIGAIVWGLVVTGALSLCAMAARGDRAIEHARRDLYQRGTE